MRKTITIEVESDFKSIGHLAPYMGEKLAELVGIQAIKSVTIEEDSDAIDKAYARGYDANEGDWPVSNPYCSIEQTSLWNAWQSGFNSRG